MGGREMQGQDLRLDQLGEQRQALVGRVAEGRVWVVHAHTVTLQECCR